MLSLKDAMKHSERAITEYASLKKKIDSILRVSFRFTGKWSRKYRVPTYLLKTLSSLVFSINNSSYEYGTFVIK